MSINRLVSLFWESRFLCFVMFWICVRFRVYVSACVCLTTLRGCDEPTFFRQCRCIILFSVKKFTSGMKPIRMGTNFYPRHSSFSRWRPSHQRDTPIVTCLCARYKRCYEGVTLIRLWQAYLLSAHYYFFRENHRSF